MTISKIASLLVVAGYIIAAVLGTNVVQAGALVTLALAILFPLALIWFPDVFGEYIGPRGKSYISQKSPAVLIAIAGWFFLIGMPLITYLISRSAT